MECSEDGLLIAGLLARFGVGMVFLDVWLNCAIVDTDWMLLHFERAC